MPRLATPWPARLPCRRHALACRPCAPLLFLWWKLVARLRRQGEAQPAYGVNSEEFMVQVHHGGFFCWPWSSPFLCQWKRKDIADGLRVIRTADTNIMASVVDRYKNLVIYCDHDDSYVNLDWDGSIAHPVADIPKVISPKKVNHVGKKNAENLQQSNTVQQWKRTSDQQAEGSGDSDSDYEDFCDSDYELDDGDDDLFVDNVDEDVVDEGVVKGKGKKAKGNRLKGEAVQARNGDMSSDDEDMNLPDGNASRISLKFKSWSEADMANPTFRVGLVFPSAVELRAAITEYGIRNMVQIKLSRNEPQRIRAHCAEGCPWNLFALKWSQQQTEALIDEPHNVMTQDVIQQDVSSRLMSQLGSTMLSQIMSEASQSSMLSLP